MSDCGRLYGDGLYGDCYYGGAEPTIPGWVDFPGVNGNFLSVLDSPALEVPKLTVVAKIRPASWTPVGNKYIASRMGGSALVWRMILINVSGSLYFGAYNSSGVESILNSSPPGGLGSYVDGDGWLWVAGSIDPDNGLGQRVMRLYLSAHGDTWIQFATSSVGAPTNIRTDSTANTEIGAANTAQTWVGDIGYAAVRNGVGDITAPGGIDVLRFSGATDLNVDPAVTSFVAATGQTVSVFRSGVSQTTIIPSIPGACEPCFSNAGCPEQVPLASGPNDRTRDLVPCPPGGDC